MNFYILYLQSLVDYKEKIIDFAQIVFNCHYFELKYPLKRQMKFEYRVVIKFLTKEELTPKMIKERLGGENGRSPLSH